MVRGRHRFKPGEKRTVVLKEGSQYREVKASTQLRVRTIGPWNISEQRLMMEDEVAQRVFGENGQNLPLSHRVMRPEDDPELNYDGTWTPETHLIGTPEDAENTSKTVYTGLDKPSHSPTHYSGLDSGEPREDQNEYPKTDPQWDGAAKVVPVMYEENNVPQLRQMIKDRGLYVPSAATKQELVDALRQNDGDTQESNTNIRIDQTDERAELGNVAKTSGEKTVEADLDDDPDTIVRTGTQMTPDVGSVPDGSADASMPENEGLDSDDVVVDGDDVEPGKEAVSTPTKGGADGSEPNVIEEQPNKTVTKPTGNKKSS